MNKEDFLRLTLKPNQITKEEIISLETVLEAYPYFQVAQVLVLKGLKEQRSFKYNKTLKKVAAYTTSRTVLFDYITSDILDYNDFSIKENSLFDIEVVDSKVIEHINASIETHEKNSQIEQVSPEEKEFKISSELKDKIDELKIGAPLTFDKKEEFSFNEFLDLTSFKEIDRKKEVNIEGIVPETEEVNSESKISKQVEMIEKFILKKPKIRTDKSQKTKDIATESVLENTSLMTETLARVYLEQKKYSKAISAFKILSLKYPEKSSFFAQKIKAIKFIQKNKL